METAPLPSLYTFTSLLSSPRPFLIHTQYITVVVTQRGFHLLNFYPTNRLGFIYFHDWQFDWKVHSSIVFFLFPLKNIAMSKPSMGSARMLPSFIPENNKKKGTSSFFIKAIAARFVTPQGVLQHSFDLMAIVWSLLAFCLRLFYTCIALRLTTNTRSRAAS